MDLCRGFATLRPKDAKASCVQLCGCARAMRAMHKGIYRAYAISPHDVQATRKAVFAVVYPPGNASVAWHVAQGLKSHAYEEEGKYSSWQIIGGLTGV